jgi:N6-adenosine-specific RNA methylase IME4
MTMPFDELPKHYYGAILADPPWRFRTWDNRVAIAKDRKTHTHGTNTSAATHYITMPIEELRALPVGDLAAKDCALFLWVSWPQFEEALSLIAAWGFAFKTCAFCWTKAHAGQLEMFEQAIPDLMGMGYWTRANTEPCLLATRGKPKRLNMDVRQAIIEPRREHSRKPSCVHGRIERLVSGPYLELFARSTRLGWDSFGDEVGKFREHDYDGADDFARSIDECYRVIRERKAAGGKGWSTSSL